MSSGPATAAELIAEHYQKTIELTLDLWKQRNRLFIFLVVAIGTSIIFTLEGEENQGNIIKMLGAIFGGDIDVYVNNLKDSLILESLQSILLVVVFFLMFNLYHRSVGVLRNYQYLGAIEEELRTHLGLKNETVVFTREGKFYWKTRREHPSAESTSLGYKISQAGKGLAKYVYVILLFILLLTLILVRLSTDFSQLSSGIRVGNWLPQAIITGVDLVVSVFTGFYYVFYASGSFKHDKETPDEIVPEGEQQVA